MAKGSIIFLAHVSEDEKPVRKLYNELKELGFRPRIDLNRHLPEKLWRLEMTKAMQKCDFFIACLSGYSIRKQVYLRKEFRTVLDVYSDKLFKRIYFIPLKFDDCDIPAIQLPRLGLNLRDVQWVDYWKPDGLVRLLETIGDKRKKKIDLFRRIQDNHLGMKFAYIPPGDFLMGSPADKARGDEDETRHKVSLTQGFYLQTTPVTQRQWKKTMGNNPSYFKGYRKDRPVESVSWEEAQKFIIKLNRSEERYRYRLPTEAEWEYAARAGSYARFCFGDSYQKLKEYAWFCDNSRVMTHPVGQKKANQWGVYDMYGNVWEWCQDCYGPYKDEDAVNPCGPSFGQTRVIRGGSWSSLAEFCRSASRDGFIPTSRNDGLGFRLVRMKD